MLTTLGVKVPLFPGMNRWQAERWAHRIVAAFRPGLLVKPGKFPAADFYEFHLVQRYGLKTGVASLPTGIEGITRPSGEIRLAEHVYQRMFDEPDGRSRFTPVHEGVHGIVHMRTLRRLDCELVENAQSMPTLYRRSEIPAFADPEWQANRIASAILMPPKAVYAVVEACGRDPRSIMTAFGVSFTAAERRLLDLEALGWLR